MLKRGFFTMIYLKKVIKRLYRIVLIQKIRIFSKPLAIALKYALEHKLNTEEKVWIDKIESLRKQLESSTAEISIVDYGAGSPDSNLTDVDMYQGRVSTTTVGTCARASTSHYLSFLLFKLIREFKPSVCLELGTNLGISAAYQATALKLNGGGKILTLEGAESLALLAQKNFQTIGLSNVVVVTGRFQDTLDNVLNEHGTINFAFIDGHHDEKETLAYFEKIFPFLSKRAVLIFDDIDWSNGMKIAWKAIKTDKRVKISVDLSKFGVCLIDNRIVKKKIFKIPNRLFG